MPNRSLIFFVLFISMELQISAQHKPVFTLQKTDEQCVKGSAWLIPVEHEHQKADSVKTQWSSGEINVGSVNNLSAGDYNVVIHYTYKDSLKRHADTTIYFTIEKILCPLLIPKYFSPNGDGYNDVMTIGNIANYPDFELTVYNKWGQRVHHQEKEYHDWDGKWLGAPLPDGTYYYVLFYSKGNTSESVTGDITILR